MYNLLVFSTEHLVLDNQLLGTSLGNTIAVAVLVTHSGLSFVVLAVVF